MDKRSKNWIFGSNFHKYSENLHFLYKSLVKNVKEHRDWDCDDYSPTMLGHPWKKTVAYSNRYPTMHTGPLQNDSDRISQKVTGPNLYVTERWKNDYLKMKRKF